MALPTHPPIVFRFTGVGLSHARHFMARVARRLGLSPWRSVVTEGHRAWARRFFNPYEFYTTMFNEEKET